MRHNNILETLQNLTLRTPKQKEIAEAIGVKLSVIGNRASRNSNYSLEELVKLSTYFGVDLVAESNFNVNCFAPTLEEKNEESLVGKSYKIPYWTDCPNLSEKLQKDGITELNIDLQLIVNEWGSNPEDLRIIAMPGDDMNGGNYPIRNKDILIIDTGRKSLYESGVYLATSHNNTRVYVRRIIEYMGSGYFTSIDNEIWKDILSKNWTKEQWQDADIRIIGRVIKNMSWKI